MPALLDLRTRRPVAECNALRHVGHSRRRGVFFAAQQAADLGAAGDRSGLGFTALSLGGAVGAGIPALANPQAGGAAQEGYLFAIQVSSRRWVRELAVRIEPEALAHAGESARRLPQRRLLARRRLQPIESNPQTIGQQRLHLARRRTQRPEGQLGHPGVGARHLGPRQACRQPREGDQRQQHQEQVGDEETAAAAHERSPHPPGPLSLTPIRGQAEEEEGRCRDSLAGHRAGWTPPLLLAPVWGSGRGGKGGEVATVILTRCTRAPAACRSVLSA
jgi:hypothetical protein